jgi:hypothetical protein
MENLNRLQNLYFGHIQETSKEPVVIIMHPNTYRILEEEGFNCFNLNRPKDGSPMKYAGTKIYRSLDVLNNEIEIF